MIDGQKMWTSLIHYADYVWLACRTDPGRAPAQGPVDHHRADVGRGLLLDAGAHDGGRGDQRHVLPRGARAGLALVGEENQGWPLITNQLNHERVALTSAAPVLSALASVREWARDAKLADGRRVIDAEWVRLNLARVHAKAEFLKLMNWRIASSGRRRPRPRRRLGHKVYGTEFAVEAYRLLMEVLGAAGAGAFGFSRGALAGRIERQHRAALILTFGGGTNEVQRDIIAAAGLGLPAARR